MLAEHDRGRGTLSIHRRASPAPRYHLLGGLEDCHDSSRPRAAVHDESLDSSDQPRDVHVVAAGVHQRRLGAARVETHRARVVESGPLFTGRPSMSARSHTARPAFSSTATTPVPPTPSVTARRRARICSAKMPLFDAREGPVRGWRGGRYRSCSAGFVTSVTLANRCPLPWVLCLQILATSAHCSRQIACTTAPSVSSHVSRPTSSRSSIGCRSNASCSQPGSNPRAALAR